VDKNELLCAELHKPLDENLKLKIEILANLEQENQQTHIMNVNNTQKYPQSN
jgi:hypothetical protein